MSGPRRHDVLVIGGGNAGLSLAGRLRRDGCRDVAVVEPRSVQERLLDGFARLLKGES